MKKLIAMLLAVALAFGLVACGGSGDSGNQGETATEMRVAMISDYSDITDQSFNQTTYEAMKAYCDANGIDCNYFKPLQDNTAERIAMVDAAVSEGYNVILMPGFAFTETVMEVVGMYPDVKFVALDVSAADLGDFELPENAFCAYYQEELCGYMAGYAVVKLGYRHLGYLGGMAVPAVQRYGYGWLQGVDAAAKELNINVDMKYVYGNQFFGDADITAYMDTWYSNGTEIVFACGGGIYTSAAEAAKKVGGKVIGVDVDQAAIIDGAFGAGMTVTSAMKGLAPTTIDTLTDVVINGNWEKYVGKIDTLGLVSGDDPAANYVQIAGTTQFADGKFTEADYKALVKGMFDGTIKVSSDISKEPTVTNTTVEYLGNIK